MSVNPTGMREAKQLPDGKWISIVANWDILPLEDTALLNGVSNEFIQVSYGRSMTTLYPWRPLSSALGDIALDRRSSSGIIGLFLYYGYPHCFVRIPVTEPPPEDPALEGTDE